MFLPAELLCLDKEILRPKALIPVILRSKSFSILASTLSTTLSVISGKFHNGHFTLIQRFIESIQNDTEPPVTLQEARDVVEVMEKVTAQI